MHRDTIFQYETMVPDTINIERQISYNDNERTIIHEQNTFVGR